MKHYLVKISSLKKITYNVLQIVAEKPEHYRFTPGQAVEVSINKDGWRGEKRPFTFTSLPDYEFLEFTIKTRPSNKSVTNELLKMEINDELILHDVFGNIAYKGEGVFIAGGAGVTPFISIFRYLMSENKTGANKLIFANNTKADIIFETEFRNLLGDNFINILTHEIIEGYGHGLITEDFLKANITDFSKYFYLCGPPPMMEEVEKLLLNLGVSEKSIIKEAY